MIAQLSKAYLKNRWWKLWARLVSYFLYEGRPLTTKGQWFNPLTKAWMKLMLLFPLSKKIVKPIFIVGTGRSGSTILGLVLSQHRQVGFMNEPKLLWHLVHPDEDVIGSYSRADAKYKLGETDATEERILKAKKLFGSFMRWSGSKRVADKYPEMIFRIPFLLKIFPDAKIIFLYRSGNESCASTALWSEREGGEKESETHDWWGANNRKYKLLCEQLVKNDEALSPLFASISNFSKQEDMAAVEWILSMKEGMKWMKKLPSQVFGLRYEDLSSNPDQALHDLIQKCELPSDEKFIRYAQSVLKPAWRHTAIELNESIRPVFEKTMSDLGYFD